MGNAFGLPWGLHLWVEVIRHQQEHTYSKQAGHARVWLHNVDLDQAA